MRKPLNVLRYTILEHGADVTSVSGELVTPSFRGLQHVLIYWEMSFQRKAFSDWG